MEPIDGSAPRIPLCVDLDGTLLLTDTTWEAMLLLFKRRPWEMLLVPLWVLRGRAFLKERIAAAVMPEAADLPYNKPLMEFLRGEHAHGRTIVLVTGAHIDIARLVAEHAGIFADVFATEGRTNLTGRAKAKLLTGLFGAKGFDYAGNAAADLHVWAAARNAIFVYTPGWVMRKTGGMTAERIFPRPVRMWRALIKAARPHQWLKNILIFVPLITAHALMNRGALGQAGIAFLSFCLLTSSMYILNDLLDLPSDRRHPRKCRRPIASGDVPIPVALLMAPLLLLTSLGLSLLLPPLFTLVLLSYFVTTFTYSMRLKQIAIVDVLVLAGLYTLRIVAGHAATGLSYSLWLLMFSMFFFFSLALIKRYAELTLLASENIATVAGRGYAVGDRALVGMFGTSSGFLSVLVMALYITSGDVTKLYARPDVLWLLLPLMLYWIGRVWLVAHRGVMHDDPIIFALKDRASYLTGLLMLTVMFLAT